MDHDAKTRQSHAVVNNLPPPLPPPLQKGVGIFMGTFLKQPRQLKLLWKRRQGNPFSSTFAKQLLERREQLCEAANHDGAPPTINEEAQSFRLP